MKQLYQHHFETFEELDAEVSKIHKAQEKLQRKQDRLQSELDDIKIWNQHLIQKEMKNRNLYGKYLKWTDGEDGSISYYKIYEDNNSPFSDSIHISLNFSQCLYSVHRPFNIKYFIQNPYSSNYVEITKEDYEYAKQNMADILINQMKKYGKH